VLGPMSSFFCLAPHVLAQDVVTDEIVRSEGLSGVPDFGREGEMLRWRQPERFRSQS
jgi:hypothetical protein